MPVRELTVAQLKQIAPAVNDKGAETFLPYLNKYRGNVDTPLRFAAFLANILKESGCFKYVREIADGSAYEGREDLGNIHPGDGKTYKGRGLIQVTGRVNYAACSKDLFGDEKTLLQTPDLLATPENAVRSAYWFWGSKKLNEIADKPDFIKVVKRINGGTNGLAERQEYYKRALAVLS